MRIQWSLWKKDLLDKWTTPDGIRFKISTKGNKVLQEKQHYAVARG